MLDNLIICICGLLITMFIGYLLSLLPAAMLGQLSWEAGYYPEQVLWAKDDNNEMVSACRLTLESEGFGSCPEVKRGDCA